MPRNLSPLRVRRDNWRTCPACGFRWDDQGGRPRALPVEDLLALAGMLRAGIRKVEAARRLGVSRQTITRWVRLAWEVVKEVEAGEASAMTREREESSPRAAAEREAEERKRAVRAAWRGLGAREVAGKELVRLVSEENRRRPSTANRWAGERGVKERKRVRERFRKQKRGKD